MRRYLIWALLHERLKVAKSVDDIIRILRDEKVTVQITPIQLTLNRERDTIVSIKRVQVA